MHGIVSIPSNSYITHDVSVCGEMFFRGQFNQGLKVGSKSDTLEYSFQFHFLCVHRQEESHEHMGMRSRPIFGQGTGLTRH